MGVAHYIQQRLEFDSFQLPFPAKDCYQGFSQ